MVNKNDRLWTIDFGGSYAAGWVDPESMETVERDDVGSERIANVLHDPKANTWDGDADKMLLFQPEEVNQRPQKVLGRPWYESAKQIWVAHAAEEGVSARKGATMEPGNEKDDARDKDAEGPDEEADTSVVSDEDFEPGAILHQQQAVVRRYDR